MIKSNNLQSLEKDLGEEKILLNRVVLIFIVLTISQIVNAKIQYDVLTAG